MNIEINTSVYLDEETTTVVAVKGRWVKLANGRNISRQEAAEAADAFLEIQIESEDEDDVELDDEESGDDSELLGMSAILAKYRGGYEKAISYTKGVTLDNGDQLAVALRGLSPADVCAIADAVYDELPGSHWARYEHLNIGQKRMSAGNRIRGALRREICEIGAVLQLAGAKIDE